MNYKRKKPRIKSTNQRQLCGGSRTGEAPGHWNILFHNRPKRRQTRATCLKVVHH